MEKSHFFFSLKANLIKTSMGLKFGDNQIWVGTQDTTGEPSATSWPDPFDRKTSKCSFSFK